MYTVIEEFRDKYDLKKAFKVGDSFNSDEPERIKDLIARRLIEGAAAPSFDFDSMTKNEIMGLLNEKEIMYDPKARKDELIELLKGGE